jgi:hypothetical protein
MKRLLKVFDPVAFQGNLAAPHHFEGWYYKIVDLTERHKLALIPGISIDAREGSSHAFLQVIDGVTARTHYIEYPLDEFRPASSRFSVDLDRSSFTAERIRLDVHREALDLEGELLFEDLVPYRSRLGAPGIMGWYGFVPFMECYHGLLSMNHRINGRLKIDGELIDFTGGRGYAEKDWGTSFPSAYFWLQSNHFDQPLSLMSSVANIPWLGRSFTGFITLLWYKGELHVLATYSGARLRDLKIADGEVGFTVQDRRLRLEVRASRAGAAGPADEGYGLLRSPKLGAMKGRIAETLSATVELRLFERGRWRRKDRLLFQGTGRNAGLELEATAAELIKGLR